MREKCPTCHGAGQVIREGYAPRVDMAELEESIPATVFVRVASKLRELGVCKGSAKIVLTLNVGNGAVGSVELDWGERYLPEKRRA